MATPSLTDLNIKKIVSFKHLPDGSLGNTPLLALDRLGIDAITSVRNGTSVLGVGEMTVLGNTYRGLMNSALKGTYSREMFITLLEKAEQLKEKALQIGVRITQSAVSETQRGKEVLTASSSSRLTPQPIASTLTEASSVYYEIVFSAKGNAINTEVFVNKQLVMKGSLASNFLSPLTLQISDYRILSKPDEGFVCLFDDMYVAELNYNSDGTVTAQLFGDLSIEPFTVASYHGDAHTNTKGVDVVTALNNFNPNEDMGVLSIKAGEAPASMTFNTPDITNKKILGAAIGFTFKDSVSPDNRIGYQITQGSKRLPAKTLTERFADVSQYTTFTQFITTPAVGSVWDANNLTFTLDLVNQVETDD